MFDKRNSAQAFLDSVSLAREKMLDSISALARKPERSPATDLPDTY
jgi:hypothetical protein